uniref:Trefoil factor 2 n=1 Tax=Canis lupus dingo TaxID=286419 RepID=A0A8C0KY93_CANLU
MDMGPRGLQLLAVLLALGLCAPAGAQKPSACQCSRIEASHRKNCGFPGISAAECFNTGCCFDSRVPNVPWCFHPLPKQESEQCVMEVAARKNCGYPGISPQEVCVSQLLLLRHHPQRALVLLPNPQSRLSLLRGVPSENPPASLGVWK